MANGDQVAFRYKDTLKDRLAPEYSSLREGAKLAFRFIIGEVLERYGKTLTLVTVYRTQEEQDAIYGVGRGKKSYHQFYQAFDLRFSPLTETQWNQIKLDVELVFHYYEARVLVHPPGNPEGFTPHVHVEVHLTSKEVAKNAGINETYYA
jgi:hypothetical protein